MSEFPTYHILIVKMAIRQFALIVEAQQIVLWHRLLLWFFVSQCFVLLYNYNPSNNAKVSSLRMIILFILFISLQHF